MAIVRWNPTYLSPFSLLQSVQEDISQVLEELPFEGFSPARWGLNTGAFVPPMDLYDWGDTLVVRADIPGMAKDKIEVSVIRNTLTIRGEKTDGKEEGKGRSERFYGAFSRSLALPAAVDSEKVTATYRDGVLEIVLPKTAESKPRQITVKT